MSEPIRRETRPEAEDGLLVFGVDPRAPSRRVWRSSLWPPLLLGATLLLYLASLIVLAGAAFYVAYTAHATSDHVLALVLAVAAALLVPTIAFSWRDYRAKRRCVLALERDALMIDLPAGRSLTHRTHRVRERIPLSQIKALDTRLESYRALTLRTYRLFRKDGTSYYLFEERALGTSRESAPHRRVVEEIAAEAGLPVTELPPAERHRGSLGAFFAAAPSWPDPSPS